jgi:Skp family chaperone for outer membrane proteins
MRGLAWFAAALLALAPLGAAAQDDLSMGQVRSPVLTIDVDRLLTETRFGQRMAAELETQAQALRDENARLFGTLRAEELSLAERRPTMEVEAFQAEAEAFDARAQRIRLEQDDKELALNEAVAAGRQTLLNAATPVLARLMIDSGAAVILERRDVFLSAGLIDVTDEAIAAIDAELGDGQRNPEETPPDEAPAPSPAPEDPGAPPDPGGERPPTEPAGSRAPPRRPSPPWRTEAPRLRRRGAVARQAATTGRGRGWTRTPERRRRP